MYAQPLDLILGRAAAATLQFGQDHATTATTQRITAHNVTSGNNDGAPLEVGGGNGSGTGKRLYYTLNREGEVVYDLERFNQTEEIREIEHTESSRQQNLTRTFEEMFLGRATTKTDSVEAEPKQDDLVELERGEINPQSEE
jgi:hypothetical protein